MEFTKEKAFWSLESFEYTLMGLAALFFLPILNKSRFELVIRWCFAIDAVFSFLGNVGYVAGGNPLNILILINLGVWAIAFPIGTALLVVVFKHEW